MSQATLSGGPYRNSNLFSNYFLDSRVQHTDGWDCDDEAESAFENLKRLWDDEGEFVAAYNEDELLDHFIDEVLDVLGFRRLTETPLPDGGGFVDRVLLGSADNYRSAVHLKGDGDVAGAYGRGLCLLEAKQWDHDFEERFSEQRQYRNASHQVKHYLERTPSNIQWGILTNGRKWRLYGTKDYETQTYYEVDLPKILTTDDLEAFKYFYALFRPDAFREVAETTYLDRIWSESETAAQELGEDLQDNVFKALRVLGRGFVTDNDLDIGPDDADALDDLKEQSLVLLYRLMFILYAEDRGLIHPSDPGAEAEYEQNFSLRELRSQIDDELETGSFASFSEYATTYWTRLEDLFDLINTGNDELGIPPYNGGLFDPDQHAFLAENEVSNRTVAEVVYRLSTTWTDDGAVPADYADLDTRHLGSIYEGLLEHHFRIAPERYVAVPENGGQVWKPATEASADEFVEYIEPGGLYVVNDDGERKASGAYYTPDYVVTYIVEETVDPLLDDIREDLEDDGLERGTEEYAYRFADRVLELKVLDPAMGSGHFLTKATGYLAEQVMNAVTEAELDTVFREEQVKRRVAKQCIYGVDLNEMAVELAKLSMWLETLAADQPLAFLDHHLKCGNSLVGSDIETIEGLESDANGDGDQYSLAEFGVTREGTIERLMDVYQEFLAIENEDLDDVKAMERKYREIEQDDLRQRLIAMANVRTAEDFGVDVPSGAYQRMARALEDDDEWNSVAGTDWFQTGQTLAREENFFHWKLEFPEVFYDEDGTGRAQSGFETVIGNPPYAQVGGAIESYLREVYYSPSYFVDLFHVFIEKGIGLTSVSGEFSYIVPEPWLTLENTEPLREFVLENVHLVDVLQFDHKVFHDATVDTIVFRARNTRDDGDTQIQVSQNAHGELGKLQLLNTIPQSKFKSNKNSRIEVRLTAVESELLDNIKQESVSLGDITDVSIGIQAYNSSKHSQETIETRAFHAKEQLSDKYLPEIAGRDVARYHVEHDGETWVKYGKHLHDYRPMRYFEEPRILVREITDTGRHRIHAAFTDKTYCNYKTILNILPTSDQFTDHYILAILNSSLMSWIFPRISNKLVSDTFPRISVGDLRELPIAEDNSKRIDDIYQKVPQQIESVLNSDSAEVRLALEKLSMRMSEWVPTRRSLNLYLPDYIGAYSDGPSITDLPHTPPKGIADSILTETANSTDQYEKLRATEAKVTRDRNTVTISLVPYVKPREDLRDEYETNSRDYATLDPVPAMRFTDLDDAQAALIETFVPYAVQNEEAGYTDSATKSISLIDRLEALTLPALDDVRDGLERYRETVARAEELDEKIERTDRLIDEIVYELYGLTEEEIEVVEEAVGE